MTSDAVMTWKMLDTKLRVWNDKLYSKVSIMEYYLVIKRNRVWKPFPMYVNLASITLNGTQLEEDACVCFERVGT